MMALDRLISVQDVADFARTFAGVGKASATRLSDGRRQFVHLTIAGMDPSPMEEQSDLFRNLGDAIKRFGALSQPCEISKRNVALLGASGERRRAPRLRMGHGRA